MELTYLGTAAAEGWPALFCRCPCCQHARAVGGKDIRTRSQAVVDNRLLLDFPPDTYLHCLHNPGFSLPEIQHLFVTHSHSDHFYPRDLEMRCQPYFLPAIPRLHVYGNAAVEAAYRQVAAHEPRMEAHITFHRVAPFQPIQAGGYTVTPLPALHDPGEECLFYLIDDGTRRLLYAHDTGVFPEPVWAYLRGRHLDLVSLDCTSGSEADGKNHMGLVDCIEVKARLLREGMADEATVFVANHFSHNGKWDHATLESKARQEGMLASYDGMAVLV